jgi:hypothetical protein
MGAARGMAAGCVYACVLIGLGAIAALVSFRGSLRELAGGTLFFLLILLYAAFIAAVVGGVLGFVFGLLFLPFARPDHVRARVISAGVAVAITAGTGLSLLMTSDVDPFGSPGWWTSGFAFVILPAGVAGAGAAHHMRHLIRRVTPEPPLPADA